MDSMNRREWLGRIGSFTLGSLLLSSCEFVSRQVSYTPELKDEKKYPISVKIVNCRQCDACMPCEYGIDIPGNFAIFNSAVRDGELLSSIETSDFFKSGLSFLTRYEAEIPDKAQAQHCISCDKCILDCPHGVNISKELENITALTDLLRDYRSLG